MPYNCSRYPDKDCPGPAGCDAAAAGDTAEWTAMHVIGSTEEDAQELGEVVQKRLGLTGLCGYDNPPAQGPAPPPIPIRPPEGS